MKTKELIDQINKNDRMYAEENDEDEILVLDDAGKLLLKIPEQATNWLEIYGMINDFFDCFGKPSREYLSSLIDDFLETPIDMRFSGKKYRLRWMDDDDGTPNYLTRLNRVLNWDWDSTKQQVKAKAFTEKELQQLKIDNPRWASAIDEMKEPVEE